MARLPSSFPMAVPDKVKIAALLIAIIAVIVTVALV